MLMIFLLLLICKTYASNIYLCNSTFNFSYLPVNITKMDYFDNGLSQNFLALTYDNLFFSIDLSTKMVQKVMSNINDYYFLAGSQNLFLFDSNNVYYNNNSNNLIIDSSFGSAYIMSLCYNKINDTLYILYSNSTIIQIQNINSSHPDQYKKSIIIVNIPSIGSITKGKIIFDDLHSDLYIVVSNYTYIYDCIQKRIWLSFVCHNNSIDELIIISDSSQNEAKFRIITFEYINSTFYIWKPDFTKKNQTSAYNQSITIANYTSSDVKIISITTILDKEFFVLICLNQTTNLVNIHIRSYDFSFWNIWNITTISTTNQQLKLFGNIESSDSFYVYDSQKRINIPPLINMSIEQYSFLSSPTECQSCSYDNLYFFNDLFGCGKTCNPPYYIRSSKTCLINSSTNSNASACNYGSNCNCFFYEYPTNSGCGLCNSSCLTCENSSTTCTSCFSGSYLYNNTCVDVCPNLFSPYLNMTAKNLTYICQNQCFANNSKTLQYIWKNSCISSCPNWTYATHDFVCVFSSCPIGYYYDSISPCSPCNVICQTCLNYYQCLTCENSSLSPDNNCIIIPTSCNSSCKSCSLNNNNTCNSCNSSLLFYNYECFSSCPSNTYANYFNKICYKCNNSNCSNCSSEYNCTKCSNLLYNSSCYDACPSQTYQNSINTCKNCNDSNCFNCLNETFCTNCSPTKYLYNGSCYTTCPNDTFQITTNKTCYKCNNSNCLNCLSEFNCTKCSNLLYNSSCYDTCPTQTFNNSNTTCKNCDDSSCSKCLNETFCTNCSNYLYNGFCYVTCPNNTFSNPATRTCSKCNNSNCSNCSSEFNCLQCSNLLYNSNCYDTCPNKTYHNDKTCKSCNDLNCFNCSSELVCTQCLPNYSLTSSQKCLINCNPNEYRDSITLFCLSCHSNCSTCFGPLSTNCISCVQPLYLKGTECFHPCNYVVPCPLLNTTIVVNFQNSNTDKQTFYMIFSSALEIPSYVNLNEMFSISIENVDPAYYTYSVNPVVGYNDRFSITITSNVSLQAPLVDVSFTNTSMQYLHGQYNTTIKIDNMTGYNITLSNIIIPTDSSDTYNVKAQAASKTFDSFIGIIIGMSVVTYLIDTRRMSLFWFLTDAMQTVSMLMFLDLNYSQRLIDFFKSLLFFHGYFLISVGKSYDSTQQKLKYFGKEIYETYQDNNYFQYLYTESFLLNGLPVIIVILIVYAMILILKCFFMWNRYYMIYDELEGFVGWLNYFYNQMLFSILIRIHFLFTYMMILSIFLQFSNFKFDNTFDKAGSMLALLSFFYYIGFHVMIIKLCNNSKVYLDDELIYAYESLFYNLELFSLIQRNHILITQVKKFLIVFFLIILRKNHSSQMGFVTVLLIIRIICVIRYIKLRPFQAYKLSLINGMTELWICLILIIIIKMGFTSFEGSNGIISSDSLNEIESNGDAAIVLILLLLGGYFILYAIIFIYYFFKHIDCFCYLCFNIDTQKYAEQQEEEEKINKSKTVDEIKEDKLNKRKKGLDDSKDSALEKSSQIIEFKSKKHVENINKGKKLMEVELKDLSVETSQRKIDIKNNKTRNNTKNSNNEKSNQKNESKKNLENNEQLKNAPEKKKKHIKPVGDDPDVEEKITHKIDIFDNKVEENPKSSHKEKSNRKKIEIEKHNKNTDDSKNSPLEKTSKKIEETNKKHRKTDSASNKTVDDDSKKIQKKNDKTLDEESKSTKTEKSHRKVQSKNKELQKSAPKTTDKIIEIEDQTIGTKDTHKSAQKTGGHDAGKDTIEPLDK